MIKISTLEGLDLFRMNVKSVVILPIESFEALMSNDMRIKIMNMLSRGPMTVTSIAQELGVLKGIVHRHVKMLEDFGWVRQLNNEEVRAIGLSREANRIYYVPSAIVYLGFKLDVNGNSMRILIPANYGAFIDMKAHRFIMLTPTSNTHECRNVCPSHDICLDWVKKTGKQYHVNVDEDDAARALISLYTQLILKEFRMYMISNMMMLDSPRLNSIFLKHAGLTF
ncbi:MAG: ArsR/SmtB family transcription factor [Vulcanisaeta sp. AZ3]|nr:MAG: ArsR family transcriptional regulator [Vulcanisaeta sp. AZ3]